MRKILFVRRPVVQVALVILFLVVAVVVFTSAQDHAWATSATVTYSTLPASGAVAETRDTLRASGTVSDTYNTLKVYGGPDWPKQLGEPPGNMGAGSGIVTDENAGGRLVEVQPYTDTVAIFNPQLPQAPRKDSITWNPLFMSESETGDENHAKELYQRLTAGGLNASEKVWFRMWYEPEHWDKDDGELEGEFDRDPITGEPIDPTEPEGDEWYPAIMQEFTYLLMEAGEVALKPEPTYGTAGSTSFVFPVGMREEDLFANGEVDTTSDNAQYGYGLTSLDANFNGVPDIVYVESEQTLQNTLHGLSVDFDGDGTEDLDPDGVELSGDELAVFRLDFLTVPISECVQFLDHMACLIGVSHAGATLDVWYTGSRLPTPPSSSVFAATDTMLVVDDVWFAYLENVDIQLKTAVLVVGRALGATHSSMESDSWSLKRFYVDGHEYNVVAIRTRGHTEFQFITIRTPIPKTKIPVTIEQHSVELQNYPIEEPLEEPLSVMPPYNFEHYIFKDVQAITAFDTDEDYVDYLGELIGPVPPILQKNGPFPYEGIYPRDPEHPVGPYDDAREVYLRYVDEDANPQFLGELKEKYGERFIEGGEVLVEAEDPAVKKYKTWTSVDDPEDTGVDVVLYSAEVSATLSYTFTGSSIYLIHNTQSNAGIANIYIDGVFHTALDMYEGVPNNWNEETLIASGLGPGNHTIVVEVSGNQNPSASDHNVLVDTFRVQDTGEELEFWYVEQWWTKPWEYTEFVLPDIHEDRTGVDNPDLYLLTSSFTAPQAEYLYWIQDDQDALLYNLSWDNGWEHKEGEDTITITPLLAGWKPRVKFWFDPAVGGKKYKSASGLRLYGRENEGAGDTTVVTDTVSTGLGTAPVEVPPYTDPWAPFNPQLPQAPRKDSLTFNPAYMDKFRHGGEPLRSLYPKIKIEGGDAREKVFFRMWYEPEYQDKIRVPDTEVYTFPALMQEFTYMYLDTDDQPSHGQPGDNSYFAFPIGTASDQLPRPDDPYWGPGSMAPDDPARFGYGLTTFDADFDGSPEAVTIHSERTLSETTGIQADFDGDGKMDQLDDDGLELTGDEMVVFAVESKTLGQNQSAMFLDYMVTLRYVSWAPGEPSEAVLKFWYTGGGIHTVNGGYSIHPLTVIESYPLKVGEMAVLNKGVGLHWIIAGGNNLGRTDGAWFVYVEGVNYQDNTVVLTIGRALGATHSAIDDGARKHDMTPGDPWYLKRFFVDGHEYNVVAIKTVPADSPGEDFEFKYITIRTPVPKVNFLNDEDSVKLEGYNQDPAVVFGVDTSIISVMPPFNSHHTRLNDIQEVQEEEFAHPDFYDDCLGDLERNVYPLEIRIVDEDPEPQFFGELKEKFWPDAAPHTDRWSTEQFHTLPDQYTDLELPAGQLYLLTSDWRSDQSWVHYYGCDPTDGYFTQDDLHLFNPDILATNAVITFTGDITNTYYTGPLRVKFWYDPDDPDGLYVGTWETTPTCVATASATSPVCEGEDIVLTGGPGGMDSYNWTGPDSFSSISQTATIPNATLAMSGTYTLTVTDDSCTATATADVTVNEKPTATASYNSPVSEGETLQLYGGPPDMNSYSWTGPASFSSSEISPTVDISATTDMAGTYTLTVTNTHGCSDYDTTHVTVIVSDENQGYLDPQHSSASYCMTTTVEIWVNVTDSFQGGEIVLEYNPDCADVTGWVRNGGDFAHGEWNSDNLGQEWIVFAADGLLTGEHLIGTLTIHCVLDSPDGCDTALDFVEPSVLTDDWGNPVPIAWVDGTFECGLGVCGDVAPAGGCDGNVNSQDYVLLLNYVGESPDHSTYYLCCDWCGDVAPAGGCDGNINSQDYVLLLNYVGESPDHSTYYLCCQDGDGGAITAPRVVPAAADNEVNLDPQESSAPFGETTDVEIWVDATNFQGGEIVLEYSPDCADVTNWVRNEDDFAHGTWNSDNPGQEWIVFAADGLLTGDYLIGTLTIRGVYEEGCATVLDFTDSSLLTDDWGNEIPATWTDGTFRSVKTYKVYLPLVMKSSQ